MKADDIVDFYKFSSSHIVKGRGHNGMFGNNRNQFYLLAVRIDFTQDSYDNLLV